MAGGLTAPAEGVLGAAAPVVSPPSDGGLALVAGPPVSDGRLGVGAAAVALVLALVPVSAEADDDWPDHQSFDARCLGEAFM